MEKEHLSPIASDVLRRCAQKLDISVNALLEEFEANWKPENGDYPRKLVEFCSSKALDDTCCNIEEKINGGSFSRFSFDIMLAREKPTSADEEQESFLECVAKEKEEKKVPTKLNNERDDIPLFYSDIMPLLVDHGSSVGEDAFVWFAIL